MNCMVVLGIDTSLRSTGYGVLSSEGSLLRAVAMGAIKNAPKVSLSGCLRNIHATVRSLIEQHRPDVLAIESVPAIPCAQVPVPKSAPLLLHTLESD